MNFDEVIEHISMVLLQKIKKEFLKLEVAHSGEQNYTKPTLAIITASDDEASKIYVRNKIKKAEEVEIEVHHFDLDIETRTTEDICNLIKSLDKLGYTGIMVQLPLADKFDEKTIIESIPPEKDVDGLTARQRIMLEDNDENALIPCTALAVYSLIAFQQIKHESFFRFSDFDNLLSKDLSGVRVLIINRSKLIGIPLSKLLRNKNATVTVAHSRTDLMDINNYLDFCSVVFPYIVTGIGKHMINGSCFKSFQTVIDCGITKDENGKLKRDIIINERDCFHYFGAVGKLTTTMLMLNLLKAYKLQNDFEDE